MSQPTGIAGALPAVGSMVQGGLQGIQEGQKKKSLMDAQQAYSTYLSKVDSGAATPEDHQIGRVAAMSLGITPPETVNPEIWKATQSAAGINTPAPGNKQNVQAVETLARLKETRARTDATGGRGDEKFSQGEWDKILQKTDPNVAPRGSLLGIAGQNNARADRALTNLNDPKMVVQQLDAVTTDIAGIMQGGSPHEAGIAGQNFRTVLSNWAAIKQVLTSNPQAINNPEIVAKLKQITNDIKRVDNKIISDNLRSAEVVFRPIIARDPQRWNDYKKSVFQTTVSVDDFDKKQTPSINYLRTSTSADGRKMGFNSSTNSWEEIK